MQTAASAERPGSYIRFLMLASADCRISLSRRLDAQPPLEYLPSCPSAACWCRHARLLSFSIWLRLPHALMMIFSDISASLRHWWRICPASAAARLTSLPHWFQKHATREMPFIFSPHSRFRAFCSLRYFILLLVTLLSLHSPQARFLFASYWCRRHISLGSRGENTSRDVSDDIYYFVSRFFIAERRYREECRLMTDYF